MAEKNKRGNLGLTVLLMVAATLLSKLLGLLRDILLASSYGTGAEAVAFESASRMPTLLFDFVLGGVVTAAFIPVYNGILTREGKASAMRYANCYLNLTLLISALLCAVGMAGAELLVAWITPGLEAPVAALAVRLTRILFPQVIFTALAYAFVGILQSMGEFNLPALISLISNAVVVLYYVTLNNRFGIVGLAVATLIGWAMQAAVQAPKAHALGYRYSPVIDLKSAPIRTSAKMALPILVSTWMQPVCSLINTRYASGIDGGRAITDIGYANRLYTILVGLFSFVATNLIFPKISRQTAAGQDGEARRLSAVSVKLLWLVILPISAGIFLLSEPFVRLIYLRGEFTAEDAKMTATALQFFALGMPALAANEVLTKLFFSRKQVRTPMAVALIAIAADLALVALLSPVMGVAGIALATGLSVSLSALCNDLVLRHGGEALFSREDFWDTGRMLLATAVLAGGVFAVSHAMPASSDFLSILFPAVVGVVLYGGVLLLLPTREVRSFLSARKGGDHI